MTDSGRRGGDRGERAPKRGRAGREERVEKVKGRVVKGRFRVDADAVADKMVEDALRDSRRRGH